MSDQVASFASTTEHPQEEGTALPSGMLFFASKPTKNENREKNNAASERSVPDGEMFQGSEERAEVLRAESSYSDFMLGHTGRLRDYFAEQSLEAGNKGHSGNEGMLAFN